MRVAPLSFAQQQIWLHAQMVPQLPVYNEPVTVRYRGALDVRVLGRTLTDIVRRHEAWRTNFRVIDGEPMQVVQPAEEVLLPFVDLSHLTPEQQEADARRLAAEDASRLFDLSQGPLFRALLVRFSDTEHRLFLTLHHIIFDGYSIYRVFLPELAAIYSALSRGEVSPLGELPVQYPDYALWEREWLANNGRLSSQLDYWKRNLADLSVLRLPSDRIRPPVQTFRGAIQPVELPLALADSLKRLSRHEGVTLFMTLLAGFSVLLHRYCAVDDIAIGTVASGRKHSQLEGLLGYFLNPVVLRSNLSGDPTFREFLRRVREVVLDALSNDDAPFTQIVSAVHASRSLSRNPLFQVLLTLEPPMVQTIDGWTAALTQSEVDTEISKFDLCLELDDRPSGLVGRFKYSTDLFEPAFMLRMSEHLKTLLQAAVSQPDLRLSELPVLTPAELGKIVVAWNKTDAGTVPDSFLHDLVLEQAQKNPAAVALVDSQGEITYRDLDVKSRQLANWLRQQGVVPDTPVALHMHPSREMVIGILGVLRSGGVCVPLDPAYPEQRSKHVMEDAKPAVLLTQTSLGSKLSEYARKTLCLDSAWYQVEAAAESQVPALSTPDDLAYLIYTSGSTGRPKGVQITHRNLVHSTAARAVYYRRPVGRFLLLSSFAFDSSLAGIFGTLSQGGTLVLTPGPLQSNLNNLSALIRRNRISHLLCVPSVYGLILEQAKPGELDTLRVALVAGESCPLDLVDRHYQVVPQAKLFNEYGPTEAAVWSTVHLCRPSQLRPTVPIGKPIPNARVYVLDAHMNPLPIGVPGELHIGGPGVVRGYWNRPEETAARFVPDPFDSKPGARLYKTGDLTRYLPSGELELLGRLDNQVKVRGVRIELEEIEAAIAEYVGVRESAVVAQGDGSELKLIAYVVPADEDGFDADALRTFLQGRLPDAMVPATFICLHRLPLTPNGKVDRRALPAHPRIAPVMRPRQPMLPLEARLIEIWESLLGKDGIRVTDNFFDLGGHSLLVAKLLLRIEQNFGKRITLAHVFQAPTVRQLAAVIAGGLEFTQHPAVVPIQPNGTKPPLIWVRGGPLFRPLAKRLDNDQPFLALHLPISDASVLPIPYTLEDLASAFVRRLREIQPEGPYYLAGLCVNGVIAYEMARQLSVDGQEVAFLALFDSQNPAYYEDFSHESHAQLITRKLEHHLNKLRAFGLRGIPGFIRDRMNGMRLRARVRYWRIYRGLRLRVPEAALQDIETILHPASFVYRPLSYPGRIVFFQSTDWPKGRYWDFYASWNEVCTGLEVHRIPGGHESMFHESNVDLLASRLRSCLTRADTSQRQSNRAIS